jgi:hypothetical protein
MNIDTLYIMLAVPCVIGLYIVYEMIKMRNLPDR